MIRRAVLIYNVPIDGCQHLYKYLKRVGGHACEEIIMTNHCKRSIFHALSKYRDQYTCMCGACHSTYQLVLSSRNPQVDRTHTQPVTAVQHGWEGREIITPDGYHWNYSNRRELPYETPTLLNQLKIEFNGEVTPIIGSLATDATATW